MKKINKNVALVYSAKPSQEEKSFWHSIVIEQNKKLWSVSFNIALDRVICEEVLLSQDGNILHKNPAIDLPLRESIMQVLKQSGVPKNLRKNTANSAIAQLAKEEEIGELKSKEKSNSKGRPVENYLRRATLRVIQTKKKEDKIAKVAKKIFPDYEKKKYTQTERSFVSQVRRLYGQTKKAWEKDTKVSDSTFEKFAKNYLKPKRRLRKTKPKTK